MLSKFIKKYPGCYAYVFVTSWFGGCMCVPLNFLESTISYYRRCDFVHTDTNHIDGISPSVFQKSIYSLGNGFLNLPSSIFDSLIITPLLPPLLVTSGILFPYLYARNILDKDKLKKLQSK
jgi:hypothetical protein